MITEPGVCVCVEAPTMFVVGGELLGIGVTSIDDWVVCDKVVRVVLLSGQTDLADTAMFKYI